MRAHSLILILMRNQAIHKCVFIPSPISLGKLHIWWLLEDQQTVSYVCAYSCSTSWTIFTELLLASGYFNQKFSFPAFMIKIISVNVIFGNNSEYQNSTGWSNWTDIIFDLITRDWRHPMRWDRCPFSHYIWTFWYIVSNNSNRFYTIFTDWCIGGVL